MVSFMLYDDQKESIREIVRDNNDKYSSLSHFYRVAVIKLIHEHSPLLGHETVLKEDVVHGEVPPEI